MSSEGEGPPQAFEGAYQVADGAGPLATAALSPVAANGHLPSVDGEDGHMTLLEHLAELRRRVLIAALAVVVGSIVGWFVYLPVFHFMENAYHSECVRHPARFVSCNLVARAPTEAFTTRLKLTTYIGAALAAPVWLWEIWRFITPGLKRNEKRYAIPFVLSAVALFLMGVGMAILVWPKALNWLTSVGGAGISQANSPGPYISLYLLVCLVFGVVFMYPIVVVFLMISGVVPTKTWRRWRRVAIVVLCAVAAVVTPSNDPFTFLGMAVPMIIFYEASIILGRILRK
jgi:sec-independent protein translocase protein TatC